VALVIALIIGVIIYAMSVVKDETLKEKSIGFVMAIRGERQSGSNNPMPAVCQEGGKRYGRDNQKLWNGVVT
jgi:hypothetical protein